MLAQNGLLSEAILLLEAAVQKGELGEGEYETWILLGEVNCMDEREEHGMRALTEGVKRAEQAGAAGAGMLVSAGGPNLLYCSHHNTSLSPSRIPTSRLTELHIQCFSDG